MPEAARLQRPDNTTPCPFVKATASDLAPTLKRLASEMEAPAPGAAPLDEGPKEVPNQVFLGRLPAQINEKRLEAALKHVGKIERIFLARDEAGEGRPCKGFGWVTFSTPEEAKAACELSEMLECGNRTITIAISCPRPRADGSLPGKRREVQIV